MSNLHDLPAELIIEILSYLWDKQDFLNVFLVCRTFHRCAEPLLYREYVNTKAYRDEIPFKPFMRRMIERPDLALHVRRIELRPWAVRYQMHVLGYKPPPISTEDICLFLNAAQKAGIIEGTPLNNKENIDPILVFEPEVEEWLDADVATFVDDDFDKSLSFDEKWIQALRLGIEDAQVILMFALLPRLEEISLRGMPPGSLPWERLVYAKKLQSLKRFSACALDGEIEWSLAQIGPFLPLPSFQVLEGYTISDTNDDTGEVVLWDSPPACSSLKQVFLECSSMNVRSAETLIRACRHLESFTFISGGTHSGPEQFTCSEIKEILMLQVQSLTHLYLDMDEEWDHAFDPGWIGSLVDFSNLKHLEIGQKCLIGTPETGLSLCNVLPSSIQTLRLEYVNQHIVSHLVRLAAVCQTQFKNLWAVMIVVDNFREFDESDGGRLDTAFNETDILLGLCLSIDLARTSPFHEWIRPQRLPLDEDLSSDTTSSSIDTDEYDEDGEDEDGWNISILEHISS